MNINFKDEVHECPVAAVPPGAAPGVTGPVAPGTAWDPDDIADHYWRLHAQPKDRWDREIVH